MNYTVLVLSLFVTLPALAILAFSFLEVRFGGTKDLDPNSLLVRWFARSTSAAPAASPARPTKASRPVLLEPAGVLGPENSGTPRSRAILGFLLVLFVCFVLWVLAKMGFTTNPSSRVLTEVPKSPEAILTLIGKLLATVLVYFMQFGFIAFEAGSVRQNYRRQSAIKNLVVFASAFLAYVFMGWKIQQYIHQEAISSLVDIAFNAGFASTVALITANIITERGTILVNSLCSVAAAGFAFPLAAGLLFEGGWLAKYGFVDTAGACVVHVLGAAFGFAAALWIKPRSIKQAWYLLGRVDVARGLDNTFRTVIGAFFLWFGWLGFNSGSVFYGQYASPWNSFLKAFVNTSIGASAGGVLGLVVAVAAAAAADMRDNGESANGDYSRETSYPERLLFNVLRELTSGGALREISHLERVVLGMMGGLVAVTANASKVEPLQALGEAMLGAFVAIVGSALMVRYARRLDDPLGAIATHGFAGIVGVMCTGLFREVNIPDSFPHGRLYSLGIQAAGCMVAIIAGLGVASLPCGILRAIELAARAKKLPGSLALLLRLTAFEEQTGKIGTEVTVGAEDVASARDRVHQGLRSLLGTDQGWIDAVRVLAYHDQGYRGTGELLHALDDVLNERHKGSPEEQTALAAIAASATSEGIKRLPKCVERALAHKNPDNDNYRHLKATKWEDLTPLYAETLVETISELAESFAADRQQMAQRMNVKDMDKSYRDAYKFLSEIEEKRDIGWQIAQRHWEFLPAPA